MCAKSTRSSSIIIGRLVVGDSRNGATVLHSLSTHTTHTRRIYSILIEFQFSISPFNWIQWKSVDETVFSALCASPSHSCPAVLALSPSSCLPVTRLMFSLLLLLFIQLLPLLGRRHQGSLVCQLWWRQRCRTNLHTHTHPSTHPTLVLAPSPHHQLAVALGPQLARSDCVHIFLLFALSSVCDWLKSCKLIGL